MNNMLPITEQKRHYKGVTYDVIISPIQPPEFKEGDIVEVNEYATGVNRSAFKPNAKWVVVSTTYLITAKRITPNNTGGVITFYPHELTLIKK